MKRFFCSVIIFSVLTMSLMAEKPVTTVLDFQTNGISENDMKSIISFLSAELFATGKYRVIDTAQRETILHELEFSASGCTDESCQLEIGKLLSAEYIVVGDIAVVGTRYILSARILETETSETTGIARGVYKNFDELVDDMSLFAAGLSENSETVSAEPGLDAAVEPEPAGTVEPAVLTEEEPVAEKTAAIPSGRRTVWAWSTMGVGVAAAGLGGYLMYSAFSYKTSTVDPAYTAYIEAESDTFETSAIDYYNDFWTAYDSAYSKFAGKLILSSVLSGVGLVSVGVSVYLFLTDAKDDDPEISLLFLPANDAATVSFRIRK